MSRCPWCSAELGAADPAGAVPTGAEEAAAPSEAAAPPARGRKRASRATASAAPPSVCPSCGATLVPTGEPEIPGVTTVIQSRPTPIRRRSWIGRLLGDAELPEDPRAR